MVAGAQRVSSDVVELSALSGAELPGLCEFLESGAMHDAPFRHVSVHGPSKGWRRPVGHLVETLLGLPAAVAGVVMHPDSMGPPELYAVMGRRLWLENMDTRKNEARTVAELERFFDALPEAGFCFDIAHAWLHDPTMELAHSLMDAFGDRLTEVHLSSIESNGQHVPLRAADVERFLPVLERCTGVPWVLEAPPPAI